MSLQLGNQADSAELIPSEDALPSFEQLYDEHVSFIWRSSRRLGISDAMVDDIVQAVFIVAYRRLAAFERRSSVKTWLFAILRRVVRDRKRTYARVIPRSVQSPDDIAELSCSTPLENLEKRQAGKLVNELLATLDDNKREVFILAELEEMSAPEIAEAIGANLNTVYARLRAARQEMKLALLRWQARLENRTL